jgi:hypothetical protein
VSDAQAAWLAEQQRQAEARAQTSAAATGKGTAGTAGTTSSPSTPAAADPPRTPTTGQGPSTNIQINPGVVSSDSRKPGQVNVSAVTSGVSGPVVVTIGSVSQTIGTGSGSFSGTITGLTAGSYPWSVSADGLVVSGPGMAVVP